VRLCTPASLVRPEAGHPAPPGRPLRPAWIPCSASWTCQLSWLASSSSIGAPAVQQLQCTPVADQQVFDAPMPTHGRPPWLTDCASAQVPAPGGVYEQSKVLEANRCVRPQPLTHRLLSSAAGRTPCRGQGHTPSHTTIAGRQASATMRVDGAACRGWQGCRDLRRAPVLLPTAGPARPLPAALPQKAPRPHWQVECRPRSCALRQGPGAAGPVRRADAAAARPAAVPWRLRCALPGARSHFRSPSVAPEPAGWL